MVEGERERGREGERERGGGVDTLQFRGLEKEKLRQIRFSSPSIVCDIDPLRNENFRLVLFVRLFSCGRFKLAIDNTYGAKTPTRKM